MRFLFSLVVLGGLLFLAKGEARAQTATPSPSKTPTAAPATATPNSTPGGQAAVSSVTALEMDNLRQMLSSPATSGPNRCRLFFYDGTLRFQCQGGTIHTVTAP